MATKWKVEGWAKDTLRNSIKTKHQDYTVSISVLYELTEKGVSTGLTEFSIVRNYGNVVIANKETRDEIFYEDVDSMTDGVLTAFESWYDEWLQQLQNELNLHVSEMVNSDDPDMSQAGR